MDAAHGNAPRGAIAVALGYTLMIAAVVAAYLGIRWYGNTLSAPAPIVAAATGATTSPSDVMLHLLLALIVVIVMARGLGTLFRSVHQPPVIGEIIAGIVLGPSVLGRLAPGVSAYVLPGSVAPFLNVISQVGVILYMFLVGLELDPALLRKRGHATVAISHASILAPFLLGAALSLRLYPRLSSSNVSFTGFSLFVGVSMSVTAFPVLARILTDRGIHKTRMGAIALTCAAVDDVTAWCLLAFVVSVVEARTAGAFSTVVTALVFIGAMLVVVRPAMVRLTFLYGNRGLTQGVMAAVFVALLLSALTTDYIGIHAIFGAFALGAVIPHDSSLARELTDRLEDLVVVLLLPAFFAFTGLRTQIGLVSGGGEWLLCLLIIVIASLGKFGGAAVAARLTGLGWRDSAALGVLMNTRGLMELIVLNIGYELGVISPKLFAMLVLMALVTTLMTTPILHLLEPRDELLPEEARSRPAAKLRVVRPARQGILVPVSNPQKVGVLLDLALSATGADDSPPRVVAFVHRPAGGVRSGIREVEQRVVPRSQALSAALEYALEREAAIVPQVSWTDSPGRDIVRLASATQAAWILLGFHRPVLGANFRGGTVHEILEAVEDLPISVGVVVNAYEEPPATIAVVTDSSAHGWASLDLATRIAHQQGCELRLLWIGAPSARGDAELQEMLGVASARVARVSTAPMAAPTADELATYLSCPLVVIGGELADRLGIANHVADQKRCTIIVYGASALMSPAARAGLSAHEGSAVLR
jgi:Kef-type K+ transport system membrane component KefB